MTMPSQPAYFSMGPMWPPMWASMMELPLDQVERKVTFIRPEQGTPAPVRGPTPKMTCAFSS